MGTQRSLFTDARGVPLALSVAGANRYDMKLTAATLDNLVQPHPQSTPKARQHLSLDKGFDDPEFREGLEARQYVEHIYCRGEEVQAKRDIPGCRSRRWVVERSHSWMNRFRRILIRWEKKTAKYQAILELACAFICFRIATVFG